MRISDLCSAMERIAPAALAESWDNTGLLCGDPRDSLKSALLCIDATDAVIAEAVSARASALIAYHPPIFRALKRLGGSEPAERRALALARSGLAVYSPHTALDAAAGGVNDHLALLVGGGWLRPLRRAPIHSQSEQFKLLTYCPSSSAEDVRSALASSGAGRIGDYECCSFSTSGTGTFRGTPSSSPRVGRKGQLERVEEVCISVVTSQRALAASIAALRSAHPYEEPAIEVIPLHPGASANEGSGRLLTLDRPATTLSLAKRLRRALKAGCASFAATKPSRKHTLVGICAGSGGELFAQVQAADATLFVTGEMKHHEVLDALARGVDVICAGHSETERAYLPVLAARLRRELPGLRPSISRADRAPLRSV
ncbi:MAG: Nif3-like dinuclear metal center hexameric protein [Phycisphaerales bacterium]|nr:Nif3-like dinuclear metal center hexameric protein [Phycisphaerales bacterium]